MASVYLAVCSKGPNYVQMLCRLFFNMGYIINKMTKWELRIDTKYDFIANSNAHTSIAIAKLLTPITQVIGISYLRNQLICFQSQIIYAASMA